MIKIRPQLKGWPVLTVLVLLLSACSKEEAVIPDPIDYGWLQGEWISSLALTQVANTEQGRFQSPSAGKLIWSIQGNRLYSTDHSIDLQQDSLFDIEEVSESELRLVTQSMDDYIINKTEFGFCSEPAGIASDLITTDCFVAYN
ncbi:MAG: hypothetical protein AB8B95_12805 [Pseudohongiellaceae bacterium]